MILNGQVGHYDVELDAQDKKMRKIRNLIKSFFIVLLGLYLKKGKKPSRNSRSLFLDLRSLKYGSRFKSKKGVENMEGTLSVATSEN